MRFLIAFGAILCCLSAVSAKTLSEQDYRLHFADFQTTYSKTYSSIEEYVERLNVFKQNLDMINAHNAQNLSWTLAVNEFADMSWEEFRATRLQSNLGNISSSIAGPVLMENEAEAWTLPNSVDWRTKGVVNAVKDQGQCGSCWAFSAVSTIESACAMRTGRLYSLSEQQVVDCSKNGGNAGCNGGWQSNAFQWEHANGGLCLENQYPYRAVDGTCRASSSKYCPVRTYVKVQSGSETALKQAVAQQPVSVTIEADQRGFQFYKSGVFNGACGTNLDHAVVAVGYGVESNGMMYWLVRNSWGQNWGEQGYIRLVRHDGSGSGQCGIALQSLYPIV
eukprot:TRINITY_DN1934_c0_g1_i1.p1 TRINITY_DN1934_c0_g1~~TRINITY_DN1934_c0_g1_i1.p1  ORF type:complete len:335 (+),score=86.34 TRINITY_DN1934_c0_g1_i1:49-1053(+)